jgi:hypothetical protein
LSLTLSTASLHGQLVNRSDSGGAHLHGAVEAHHQVDVGVNFDHNRSSREPSLRQPTRV